MWILQFTQAVAPYKKLFKFARENILNGLNNFPFLYETY